MSDSPHELHRPVPLDRVTPSGYEFTVEANAAERASLARRLDVPGVAAFTCRFRLSPGPSAQYVADGLLRARLTRICVVSLDEFESDLTEAFRIRFVPAGRETEELDPEADDEIPYEGITLDLGEAAAEQLALALDPYPRKPGVDLPQLDAEPDDSPFGALSRLRRPD